MLYEYVHIGQANILLLDPGRIRTSDLLLEHHQNTSLPWYITPKNTTLRRDKLI